MQAAAPPLAVHERLMDHTLQFYYESGNVTQVYSGEVAGWRVMTCANIAHVSGGDWKIEREDVGELSVRSGEACYIPAGVRHRSAMLSEGSSQASWAHFNVFLCGYVDLFSFFEMPPVFRGEAAARLGDILAKLAQLQATHNPFSLLLQRKVLEFELAATLIGEATPKYLSGVRLQQIQRVLPVLELIHENVAARHTRESLAAVAHLSPSRFAAVFKAALGMAPIDYVVKLRMQRAQQLLQAGEYSVEQVASQVGFQDAFYFSRLFKAHFGCSPAKYRKLALQSETSSLTSDDVFR